jgi:hypothetical protein
MRDQKLLTKTVEYRAVFWSLPVMAAYRAAYMAARMAAYMAAYSDAYRPHSGSLYCLTVLKTINGVVTLGWS